MFGVLVESAPLRHRSLRAGATSTIAHTALVLLAVGATMPAPSRHPGGRSVERVVDSLVLVAPPPPEPDVPPAPRARRAPPRRAPATAAPRPTASAIDAALAAELALPEIDLGLPPDAIDMFEARATDGVEFADGLHTGGSGAVPIPVYADVYREMDAERRPVVLPGTGEPEYPVPLLRRGIGGTVVARFVIDSTGKPVAGSIEILSSTDELFARSVWKVMRRIRFEPAQLAGRAVKVLVEQPFRFVVR